MATSPSEHFTESLGDRSRGRRVKNRVQAREELSAAIAELKNGAARVRSERLERA